MSDKDFQQVFIIHPVIKLQKQAYNLFKANETIKDLKADLRKSQIRQTQLFNRVSSKDFDIVSARYTADQLRAEVKKLKGEAENKDEHIKQLNKWRKKEVERTKELEARIKELENPPLPPRKNKVDHVYAAWQSVWNAHEHLRYSGDGELIEIMRKTRATLWSAYCKANDR